MNDELRLPAEGLTTLGAAFTRDMVAKVKKAVLQLQGQGKTDKEILLRMKKDLPDFNAQTIRRLFDLSVGQPVKDDFSKAEVSSHKATKKDTIEIELLAPRTDLISGSLVRYLGADWYVSRFATTGQKFILRKLS